VTSLNLRRPTSGAGEMLIIYREDYPACIALATIGLAAVRSTPRDTLFTYTG